MPVFNSNVLAGAAGSAGAAGADGIIKSLRFNSDDEASLSRTPSSAGNRRTWTWSCWAKRGKISNENQPFLTVNNGSQSFIMGWHGYYGDGRRDGIEINNVAGVGDGYVTTGVFRDPSAWYHVVVAFNSTLSTSSDRIKIWVNNEAQTFQSTSNGPGEDQEWLVNSATAHTIGDSVASYSWLGQLDSLLADVYFIDGSALDPTSFGAYDDNGVWQVAEYSGTYTGNSFHLLDFANEATVGHDSSGNENDFTASDGISTTAGTGNDVSFDVPVNGTQSDTGEGGEVSGNYATWNPLSLNKSTNSTASLSNGNLDFNVSNSGYASTISTIAVGTSGKYYCEISFEGTKINSTNYAYLGVVPASSQATFSSSDNKSDMHRALNALSITASHSLTRSAIGTGTNNTNADWNTSTGYDEDDVIGIALDFDNNVLAFYKNGTSLGTYPHSLQSGENYHIFAEDWANGNDITKYTLNAGQRSFVYAAPSGHKALCTTNLPTPTIADGSDYFDIKLWTGNATDNRDITGYEFSPDFVWIKETGSTGDHHLFDIVRGATKAMRTNNTDSEVTDANELKAFNSDGFRLGTGGDVNASGTATVGWAWDAGSSTVTNNVGDITTTLRANPTAGFSIATYSGSGTSGDTLGHGLNAKPEFVIIKARTKNDDWRVYHKGVGTGHYLRLNGNHSQTTTNNWQSVSTTTFGIDSDSAVNSGSHDYLALFFAPVEGFSKFGTYVGNTTNTPFVYTGFRPAFLLIKSHTSTEHWAMLDTTRSPTNHADDILKANSSDDEDTDYSSGEIDILSNGFKLRGNWGAINHSSGPTYIYAAFAENPFSANGGLAR